MKNYCHLRFPCSSVGEESDCKAEPGLIPRLGRSPGEGNGTPLQDSCLENPMDRGGWQVPSPWGHKSRTRLSNSATSVAVSLAFISSLYVVFPVLSVV